MPDASIANAPTAFTPLKVGRLTLSSRVALAPLTRVRADDSHTHHPIAAEYYSQRASYPGTLLIAEGTLIHPRATGWPNVPGIYTAAQIAAWKNIVDAVHAQGSFLYLQIFAPGRAASLESLQSEDPSLEVVAPSAIPMEGGALPRAISEEEIEEYVQWHVAAAKAFIEEAGGDGVEVHAANGYLLDEFLNTNSNARTDKYGGNIENRARFPLEAVRAVSEAVGEDRVGVRISPFSDFQGMKLPLSEAINTFTYFTQQLKERHPDLAYLHAVSPRASGAGDATQLEGESLDFIARIWGPKPFLIAGGLGPKDADEVASRYEGAVAVYGRHFVSNPDLVARIKHKVELRAYDRASFYLAGPTQSKGYTEYPVKYGVDGKL